MHGVWGVYLMTLKFRELAPTNLNITEGTFILKLTEHTVMSDKGQSCFKNILFTVPLTVEG